MKVQNNTRYVYVYNIHQSELRILNSPKHRNLNIRFQNRIEKIVGFMRLHY